MCDSRGRNGETGTGTLIPRRPTPIVLAFHGAVTNGSIMALSTGLNRKADEAGFVAVYPNGTGDTRFFLNWNVGGKGLGDDPKEADDLKFVRLLLDDLASKVNLDPKRVYATGHSNGGMMCYWIATELPRRIAAIAPVSAEMPAACHPKQPVPVIHFHGTQDARVPFGNTASKELRAHGLRSVLETMSYWSRVNRCASKPILSRLPDKSDDDTSVKQYRFVARKSGADVVLVVIEGGGHTWPGRKPLTPISGESTMEISANDLIWDFFKRHTLR